MSTGPNTPEEPKRPQSQQPPPPPDQGQVPPPQRPPQAQPTPGVPQGYSMGPQPMRPDEEKLWAIGAHIGPILVGFIAPLIVWLVFKERSQFLDRHGKEALNMQLSYLIYFIVAGFSIIVLIGLVLLPVVGVAWLVLMIIATIKAANFEDYRYPAIIRFVH